ncbi:unnamed protein product [Eruca vesicaria subsp. sativa]|uniref:Uncharacterized protein n=1 Tax=Eruca vesicaria subsp. sativa TaxID=29727 RepID=A0ABC8JR76_ERUVS|nr:unnamed protein product [Eruca vesicaria subsp. sativa]
MSEDEREERWIFRTLMTLLKNENLEIPNENRIILLEGTILQKDDKLIELREARELLDEKISILRKWQDPDRVVDLARLTIMDDHLVFNLSLCKKVFRSYIK